MSGRATSIAIAAALAFTIAGNASSQEYPAKPVRIIVPTAAGGLTDLLPRTFAQKSAMKQPFVVENRAGAGGIIGADAVAKSAPDGYTLMLGFHGTQSILPALGQAMPYDAAKDFEPVILIATVPNVLVVGPAVPAASLKDLVVFGKAHPKKLSFASQGTGSSGHVAGELFRLAAGIDAVHVAYKGAAPAIQDVIGGQVSMMFDVVPLALPNVRAGKLKALAIASKERAATLPDVPTMIEAGLPEVEGGAWFALYAPAGTPRAIVDALNREATRVFSDPEVRDRFTAQGASFPLGSPESLREFQANETKRWTRVAKEAGIKLD